MQLFFARQAVLLIQVYWHGLVKNTDLLRKKISKITNAT